ncbi:hypothetical protein ACFFUE_10195 [Bergeyella porcorum]|uniref:hypothetical protein n=1 Tax=Bergeyella porcorum TaxID=1735111 RepID=UPI0035EB06F6
MDLLDMIKPILLGFCVFMVKIIIITSSLYHHFAPVGTLDLIRTERLHWWNA